MIGDVNGDGIGDFLVGSPGSHVGSVISAGKAVVVFGRKNIASSVPFTFQSIDPTNGLIIEGEFDTGRLGTAAAGVGDVNGDGVDDFAVSSPGADHGPLGSEGSVSLIFGSQSLGAGGPLPSSSIVPPIGNSIVGGLGEGWMGDSLAGPGDVDLDGTPDLLIGAPRYGSNVVPALGGFNLSDLAAGDLDGDGDADLVGTNEGLSKLTLFESLGGGSIQMLSEFGLPGRPQAIFMDDVDGDGDLDLVAATYRYFQSISKFARSIVVAKNEAVWTFGAPAVFEYLSTSTTEDASSVALGDVDNNGRSDFVAVCETGGSTGSLDPLVVIKNTGSGSMVASPPLMFAADPGAISLGDIDGDGDIDGVVIVGAAKSSAKIAWNSGAGQFTGGNTFATLTSTRATSLRDVDSDQLPDLVTSGWQLFKNLGGFFGPPSTLLVGNETIYPIDLQVLDMDQDGDPDIAAGLANTNQFIAAAVRFNQGSGSFGPAHYASALHYFSIFTVADISGDGIPDLAGGVTGVGPVLQSKVSVLVNPGSGVFPGTSSGAAFLIRGSHLATAPLPTPVELLNGADGFAMRGKVAYGAFGYVSRTGDVDGDGIHDFAVAAPALNGAIENGGRVLVVRGSAGIGASGSIDIDALDTSASLSILGADLDGAFGRALAGGFDQNQDGLSDLLIAAQGASPGGVNRAGRAYLLRGSLGIGASADISVADLDGTNGFAIDGYQESSSLGFAVAAADLNGDGPADLLIGAPSAKSPLLVKSGAAYVVYGTSANVPGGVVSLGSLSAASGTVLWGYAEFDSAGQSVAAGGDVNGDGIQDFLVGVPFYKLATPPVVGVSGVSYLILGRPASVKNYGAGVPGCAGSHLLTTSLAPKINSPTFQFRATRVPPLSLGLCLVADKKLTPPADLFSIGVPLHLDLITATEVLAMDFFSDALGFAEAAAPLPNLPALVGKSYFAQGLFGWAAPCTPSTYGLSSTHGIEVKLLP